MQFQVTIQDIKPFLDDHDFEVRNNVEILWDFYHDDEEGSTKPGSAKDMLRMYSEAGSKALSFLGHVPYYSESNLVRSMLSMSEFPEKSSDLFPLPIYVSSGASDRNTIGIMVHYNGKLELFEGNDEASDETYHLVNVMLNPRKEQVTVYGMHTEDLVDIIRKKEVIPSGIYVSPNKTYAAGHFDLNKQRVLFSCKIDKNCVRQESDVDWKVMVPCNISQLKLY